MRLRRLHIAIEFSLGLTISATALRTVGPIQFEDRQRESGIGFVLDNGATPDKPIVEAVLGGVALLDFDDDGRLDVFFTNGARIRGSRRTTRGSGTASIAMRARDGSAT